MLFRLMRLSVNGECEHQSELIDCDCVIKLLGNREMTMTFPNEKIYLRLKNVSIDVNDRIYTITCNSGVYTLKLIKDNWRGYDE